MEFLVGFLQVGLEPKEFELRVSCKGYVDHVEIVKIPLGDTVTRNVVLLTPEENLGAAVSAGKAPAEDAGMKAENEATESFNKAVSLYNERKFAEAQPLLATAQVKFQESLEKTKEEDTKATLRSTLGKIDRVLGIVYAENFLAQPASEDLATKALKVAPGRLLDGD